MHLYVLGPGFDLPSIDAECNAAIALVCTQLDDWQLIPTHDDSEGLPLLVDGETRINGFASIAHYLSAKGGNEKQTKGDEIAITSFLRSQAQLLLDISLYVSFENYTTTRSAYTKVLPWHINYLLPPRKRNAARQRTEHLGISSIDVDDVHEDLSGRPAGFDGVGKEEKPFEVETQKRASLLLPRKDTLRGLLRKPEHSSVFKLHALADNFFGPLQDMLDDKQYLLDEELSGVDCLAYGYLSLMLFPQLPQDWLATTMKKKYGTLVRYVEHIHRVLKLQTNAQEVMSLAQCNNDEEVKALRTACGLSLPWCAPATSSFTDVFFSTGRELVSHIPTLSPPTAIMVEGNNTAAIWQNYLPAIFALSATSLGLGIYVALRTGLLVWPRGEQIHHFGRKRFADYGHLGAALGGLSLLNRQAAGDRAYHAQQEIDDPTHVDVAVLGDDQDVR